MVGKTQIKIWLPAGLYESMPLVWSGLFFASLGLAIVAPHWLEIVTSVMSIYKAISIVGMRAEARFVKGDW